jgi:hypothetical protein
LVVIGVIALIVLPSFLLLFWLSQRGLLVEDKTTQGLLASLPEEVSGADQTPGGSTGARRRV